MRISDWSSDVCSSDLDRRALPCPFVHRQREAVDLYHSDDRLTHALRPSCLAVAPGGDGTERSRTASRSEERRAGTACVGTCRSRWWPYHIQQKQLIRCKTHCRPGNTCTYL